jgi:predicted transcriptional regulator
MNAVLLIHAIVRQTTVLIAALATASGQRAQLASVANLVFADLVRELREQGLGNKVIADMFGMVLRTYHRKLARLSSSRTVQGRSLWEAVLGHIQQHGPLLRSELLQRFGRDDESTLRAVVADLAESGLVRIDGTDDAERVQATELVSVAGEAKPGPGKLEGMMLVALHRGGPLTLDAVSELVPADRIELEQTLARLVSGGLVTQEQREAETLYGCESCVIQFGDEAGWEAAVFDHYQAMVVAMATKLRAGARRAELADSIGGSTFVFDLWQGHPMQAEVLGYLKSMRTRGMELRKVLERHNAASPMPQRVAPLRVTAYVGQSVTEMEGDEDA